MTWSIILAPTQCAFPIGIERAHTRRRSRRCSIIPANCSLARIVSSSGTIGWNASAKSSGALIRILRFGRGWAA